MQHATSHKHLINTAFLCQSTTKLMLHVFNYYTLFLMHVAPKPYWNICQCLVLEKKAGWGTGQSKLLPNVPIHESLDKAKVPRYWHEDNQRCQVCNLSWWEEGNIVWNAGWPRLIWNETIKNRTSLKKEKKR